MDKMIKKSLLVILVLALSMFVVIKNGHAEMREFVVIDKTAPATLREAPNGRSSLG